MPELSSLENKTVYIQGKLVGMTRRKVAFLLKPFGSRLMSRLDESVNLVVFGEHEKRQLDFDDQTRELFEQGNLQTLTEREFLVLLTPPETESVSLRSLYTPGLLAELVGVTPNMIRLWVRRGWLIGKTRVGNLAYFDETETIAAKHLATLSRNGVTADTIAKKMETLALQFPELKRPLVEIELHIDGKRITLLKNDHLVNDVGQNLFRFEPEQENQDFLEPDPPETEMDRALTLFSPTFPEEELHDKETLCEWAVTFEEQGDLARALDCYRTALATGGSDAVSCFQMAGILYQLGDLSAARERYLMAIELDENFVEARAGLGVLFAEMGENDLAISALEGALDFHDGYADVHYQLGLLLEKTGNREKSRSHLQTFLELAPNSPWSDKVRDLLEKYSSIQ